MKLIKVLFLFVFITSVNNYVSQGTYQLDQTTTDGVSLTAELYISEYSPNQNIQCKDSIDGRAKIEITSGSGPFQFKWYTNNNILLRDNTTSNPSDSLVGIGEMANSYVFIYVAGALKMNFVFNIQSSPNILLIAPTLTQPVKTNFRPYR